ncbi:crossover junction endodeoxyribonuclease RuvC [Gemmata sp. JC673]|uniref:Crossover junction endodeoxyribonuclease RuvC n=1 Tax=Gemmata algarum TaxID=2975278 RepID=A0ABU5EW53_9BACT|nr:crossover junction endodeoxyribonuclease RuvC [Gemmata algarum]MDY3559355.1 crossover junction endodeoxyribonuclease RuvC [Gemmata algarum]
MLTPPPDVPEPRRILGIDPGLQTTGYGVLEVSDKGPRVVDAGVIRSADGRDSSDMARRVKALYDGLSEVLGEWKPSALAIEQLYAHYDHPRTAILMAHARGVYLLAAAQHSIPVTSYAPTKVKKLVTGHGHAVKEQMQYAVMRELNLAKLPEPHDVADALGIALCHYFATGSGVMGRARGATFTGVNMKALLGAEPDPDELTEEDTRSESA